MSESRRGPLDGPGVQRGAWLMFPDLRIELWLRADEQRVVRDARWDAPASVGSGHPAAECLEQLCEDLVGVELKRLLRLDDHDLGRGLPGKHSGSEAARAATGALRSALEKFRPGARGPGYLSSGLLLAPLPRGTRPKFTEPGSYFRHHFREELWAAAATEARRGGPLGPKASCAFIDALLHACPEPVELDFPVEEGAAGWAWLNATFLPLVTGSAARAHQLVFGGYGDAVGSGSFHFGHLDGGPWRAPAELELPTDAEHAEFVLMELESKLPNLPADTVVVAAPRWMAVGLTHDSPEVRFADIPREEMGAFTGGLGDD